jgi:hypothetical protein
MIKFQDAYMNADNFNFEMNQDGVVQLSFGPTHVCMSLDAAFDLQYQLAAFLSDIELDDYPNEEECEDLNLTESRKLLEGLSLIRKPRRLDA